MTPSLRRLAALAASIAAPMLAAWAVAFMLFGLPAPAQAANVVVSNCTTTQLRAAIQAAGASGRVTFACPGGAHTFTFTQTQALSQDVTIDGGGVITLSGGDTDRIFSVPSAQKATLLNLTLTRGHGGDGGAVSIAGRMVISNVTFTHNAATGFGGAVAVTSLGTANVSGSHFFSNTAVANGGALYSNGLLTVDGSFFTQNTAPVGGAIYQAGGSAAVAGSNFIGNLGEFGGAIETQASLTLAGDEFDHNGTPLGNPIGFFGGGALYVAFNGQGDIRQSIFFSNTADNGGSGGAIANEGALSIFDTLFNQNRALGDGGALINDSQAAYITQTTFARNTALGEGGAISNTGFLVLYTSALLSNTAGVSGGALAWAGARGGALQSVFFNNSAPSGGAVRNHGGMGLAQSTLYSNTALTGAGGAALNNGDLTLVYSTLAANAAPNASGGALMNNGPHSPGLSLINVTLVSNTAASGGAGLRNITGTVLASNSILAFNAPDNCQGAITPLGHNLQFHGLGLSCGNGITNTNPLLGPLQDNGGPRLGVANLALPTLLPLTGSPAINAGIPSGCPHDPAVDERGYPIFGICDLGAVERVFPADLPTVRR